MLANSYKTAAELGISEVEVQALVKVLGMLERGELHDVEYALADPKTPFDFCMAQTTASSSCGTIGCIAGWAYVLSNGKAFSEIKEPELLDAWTEELRDLFGIGEHIGLLFDRKTKHAALALRSYLTTGDARWDLALAD